MNGLNTNAVKPLLKEIVFIGKAIANFKSEIINYDPERVIHKPDATSVKDIEVFAINMKLVDMVVTPDNEAKRGQRRISSDF